jgi:transcriptional regulator with XRE-family HTH domain
MPPKPDLSGTTLARRQLGKQLKDIRVERGLTLDQLAARTDYSRTVLSRVENGQQESKLRSIVDHLCAWYGLKSARAKYLQSLTQDGKTSMWLQNYRDLIDPGFDTYIELESIASKLTTYNSLVVPGLLQTADYTRTMRHESNGDTMSAAEVERNVEFRRQRAAILTRAHGPVQASFLLSENLFTTIRVGTDRQMAQQCYHVADLSTRDNISVRILKYDVGFPTGLIVTPYTVLGFPDDEPTVVFAETTAGSEFFEREDQVKHFHTVHETLQRAALGEQESRDRLRKIARRYEQ